MKEGHKREEAGASSLYNVPIEPIRIFDSLKPESDKCLLARIRYISFHAKNPKNKT